MRLRIVVPESKTWRWLERIGLSALGFATLLSITGIVLMATRHPANRRATSAVSTTNPSNRGVSVPSAAPAEYQTTIPEQTSQALVAIERQSSPAPMRGPGEPSLRTGASKRGARLRGRNSVVVVAVAEADAAELLLHPDRLVELIQQGSLFSVPNDTAVAIAETHAGLIQVHVIAGDFEGRDGWVSANQVVGK